MTDSAIEFSFLTLRSHYGLYKVKKEGKGRDNNWALSPVLLGTSKQNDPSVLSFICLKCKMGSSWVTSWQASCGINQITGVKRLALVLGQSSHSETLSRTGA